jgi:menaquinone-dependent protoporphyrinogen oxidase
MANIAVVYGTTEGQTAKIAQRVAGIGRQHGHHVEVVHLAEVDASFEIAAYDGVVVGASIHEGSHQRYVYRWLKAQQAALARIPTAAFTVCLAIRSLNEDERAEARAFSTLYEEKTGWKPDVSEVFAGALMYSEYNWLVRMVMKSIARHEGGSTDTAHDTEYTNWAEVDRFAEAFFSRPELDRRGRAPACP